VKTQTVRLIDVFALGPFMVWSAFQLKPPIARDLMLLAGALTIIYNGINYQRIANGEGPLP
jgi:hypothetical protein